MTTSKNNWSNAFRNCFCAPASCAPPMQASFQDHRKSLSDNRGCFKFKPSLFPLSAVDIGYILYVLKLKLLTKTRLSFKVFWIAP